MISILLSTERPCKTWVTRTNGKAHFPIKLVMYISKMSSGRTADFDTLIVISSALHPWKWRIGHVQPVAQHQQRNTPGSGASYEDSANSNKIHVRMWRRRHLLHTDATGRGLMSKVSEKAIMELRKGDVAGSKFVVRGGQRLSRLAGCSMRLA